MTSNDIFVFSIAEGGGRICAYRSARRYGDLSLYSLSIPKCDLDFIVKNLSAHSKDPLLVNSDGKAFLVSLSHYPSSRLCLGVRVNASLSLTKKICREIYGDHCIAPSFFEIRDAKRANEKERNEILKVLEFISELSKINGVLRDTDGRSAIIASQRVIGSIERFIDCRVDVVLNAMIPDTFDYDISLFSSFALCSLLFAYDKARSRCATLEFSEISGKLLCSFSFELDGKAVYENNFCELDSHMEALGMYFALFKKDRHIIVEACAVRFDLSLIGIKNDPAFNFN